MGKKENLGNRGSSSLSFVISVVVLGAVATSFYVFLFDFSGDPDMEAYRLKKNEFLQEYKGKYGYGGRLDALRRREFPQLNGQIYLDYTGAGQYQKYQLEKTLETLTSDVFGNIHSRSPSSINSEEMVEDVRGRLLSFFNVSLKEYSVIFTSGATGALKMIGEMFPWSENSEFLYLESNHNSVLGIRELAADRNALYTCTSYANIENEIEAIKSHAHEDPSPNKTFNLFAYPAECNFSGKKYPLELIHKFQDPSMRVNTGRWFVLLDAAALVPTDNLDLSEYPADFVTISFYKMFGYPSGLGALLVRRGVTDLMEERYFGGGTVTIATAFTHFHQPQPRFCSQLEAGTLAFLNIISLNYGFDVLDSLGMDNIRDHTNALVSYLAKEMKDARHSNGKPLVEVYGNDHSDWSVQGPIFNFNIKDMDGDYVSYYQVQTLTANNKFHIRTGCVCNPGACYGSLGIMDSEIMSFAKEKTSCGDEIDFIHGKPAGSIRVSLGYPTTFEEVHAFVTFIKDHYLNADKESYCDVDLEE